MPKRTLEEAAKVVEDGFVLAEAANGLGPRGVTGHNSRGATEPFGAATDEPSQLFFDAPVRAPEASEDGSEEPSALPEGYGFGDAYMDAFRADSLAHSLYLAATNAGFEFDPNWSIPDANSDLWKELSEGIPEEFQDNLAETVSEDHARYKADRIREELGREQRLYEYAGIAGRLGLSLINPENIAVTAATLGVGALPAVARSSVLAAEAAETAAAMGRAQAALRAGGRAAAANAAYDATHIGLSETRSPSEVAFSATAGLLLGGTLGSLGAGLTAAERARFVKAARKEMGQQAQNLDAEPTFGAGSAGAAERGTPEVLLRDDSKLEFTTFVPEIKDSLMRRGIFRDTGADILAIQDPVLRSSVGVYYGDPVGAVKGGPAVPIGANEEATSIRAAWRFKLASEYEPSWKSWARENGVGGWNHKGRRQFGEAVTAHRLGWVVSDNPHVIKAAAAMDKFYSNALKEAREAGVKGIQDVKTGPYRPRVWRKDVISELSRSTRMGGKAVARLIAKAFKANNPDVSDEIADKLGEGVLKKLRESNAGLNTQVIGFRQADGEWLQDLVREINTDGSLDDVEGYLKSAFKGMLEKSGRTGEGTMAHQKHRLDLDENAFIDVLDNGTGRTTRLHLRDLFDNDAGELADIYGHRMSGATAFAKRGVTDEANHKALMEQVISYDEANGRLKDGKSKAADSMDQIWKLAHGQSLVAPGESPWVSSMRGFFRGMRDLAFSARMNMMWVASIPDSAAWLVTGQSRRLLRNLPELSSAITEMRKGNFDNNLLGEILTHTGIGTEGVANDVFSAFDDDLMREALGMVNTTERVTNNIKRGLRKMNRVTAHVGGVYWKQNFDQKMFGYAYANRLADNALGLSGDLSAQRLASAGLDKPMMKRIGAMIEAHSDTQKAGSGVKVRTLNTDDWTDREAASAFWGAVAREGRRSVQSENYGEAPKWMNHWFGKVLGQFRRFGIVAQTKQLLYGVRHRDMETLQRVLAFQLPLGMLGYAAQMTAYSYTQPDPQAFRDKYLTPGHVLWAGFARAGFVGMLPALVQGGFESATGTSINSNIRVSGSGTDLLDANSYPALDMLNRFGKLGQTMFQSAVRGDRQFDQQDFRNARGLLPGQNAPAIKQMLDMIQNTLPENDDDSDPDETEWFFE